MNQFVEQKMKKLLLKPPAYDDLLRLLVAWRVWLIGAVVGAILATIVYLVSPPPYRAQATVLVDQNVEKVIPAEETDLQRFNYLQEETNKLFDVAWSDQTLKLLSAHTGMTLTELRDGRLQLTQPGQGGWHFLANASTSGAASELASAWASAFVEEVNTKPAGISKILEINFTQKQDLPIFRTVSMGAYVFGGSLIGAALLALVLLFFHEEKA